MAELIISAGLFLGKVAMVAFMGAMFLALYLVESRRSVR
jgi:hypothetical protein